MIPSHRRWRGFSLLELITVVGIIAILIALLMPTITAARKNAQAVQCASNMRQLAQAMIAYAGEFSGKFPPNTAPLKMYWYNKDEIGRHITAPLTLADQTLAGGVLVCPSDIEGAVRSYAMNVWASGLVSQGVIDSQTATPPKGKLFSMGAGGSSNLILLAEAFSAFDAPEEGDPKVGYMAHAVVGFVGARPGDRFLYAGEPDNNTSRFGPTDSQICYSRHRTRADAYPLLTAARGRANFAFLDGHVQLMHHTDLANLTTGKSTYAAMWTPIDREID